MSKGKATVTQEPDENFQSTDSLDGLLRSMSGPVAMDMETKLDAQKLEDWLNHKQTQDVNATAFVEIIEEPKQKELRFRYECEGRSAGSLPGQKSDLDRKTFPTIKIHNYQGPVKVLASLVSRQKPPRPHPHGLVGKDCQHGVCGITAPASEKMQISFPNLGIQCVKQKEIIDALKQRRGMRIDPFQWFANSNINLDKCKPKSLDFEMNVVCICFQVFIPDPHNPTQFTNPLPPVVTHPIFDKKGATLHIARCDKSHGSVKGGDEIFILCDKVQREDVEVIFYSELLQWEAKAHFGPNDIHRQVAIVCKTPKFKDLKIDRPVNVEFLLRRPSDMEQSDPVTFTYVPFDEDSSQISAKRKRKAKDFKDYFKGNTEVNVKVESLSEGSQPSCSYDTSAFRGSSASSAASTAAAPIVVPQLPVPKPQITDVKKLLRGKLINKSGTGYDIKTPPKDPAAQDSRRVRRPAPTRSPKMAAQFNNQATPNFESAASISQSGITMGQGNSTIAPGVFGTINLWDTFGNAATFAQMTNVPMSATTAAAAAPTAAPTAEQLLNAMQEGAAPGNNELQVEEDRAVEHLLAGMPGSMAGPSVETVANPSSVIELNSAGNWQLDGVEIPANLAEEISTVAAQLMQTTRSGDLERFDFNQLQDTEILISDPNSPAEMMMEDGINNSVSIPYSNSVELGAQPPNATVDSQELHNNNNQ